LLRNHQEDRSILWVVLEAQSTEESRANEAPLLNRHKSIEVVGDGLRKQVPRQRANQGPLGFAFGFREHRREKVLDGRCIARLVGSKFHPYFLARDGNRSVRRQNR
jgi:hypothetical protein